MSYIIKKKEDFIYIHRILNTNINGKRRIPYALAEIKGIGIRLGYLICKILKIDPTRRAGELNENDC
jgi:ribosomal protein S13